MLKNKVKFDIIWPLWVIMECLSLSVTMLLPSQAKVIDRQANLLGVSRWTWSQQEFCRERQSPTCSFWISTWLRKNGPWDRNTSLLRWRDLTACVKFITLCGNSFLSLDSACTLSFKHVPHMAPAQPLLYPFHARGRQDPFAAGREGFLQVNCPASTLGGACWPWWTNSP